MRFLVDTHIFIWWINGDRRLASSLKRILKDPSNQIYVSIVSALEMAVKKRTGKLKLKTNLKECFQKSRFEMLDLSLVHVLALDRLPLYHKDPFDRILISQAQVENLILVSVDQKIKKYKVKTLPHNAD